MNRTNLKILFVLPEYYPHSGGGISTYYLAYLKNLSPFCERIRVIVGSGYTQSDETYQLGNVVVEYLKPVVYEKYRSRFSSFDILPDFGRNVAAAWAMWEQANGGEGYDVIECTDFGLGYIPWLINHDRPVVTRLHGSHGQIELNEPQLNYRFAGHLYRLTELALLPKSDLLITYSRNNQVFWEKLIPDKKIELIHPVCDLDVASFLAFGDKQAFGMVSGRIQQWKGPDVLCEALKQMPNFTTPIRWYGRDTTYDLNTTKSSSLKKTYPHIWGNQIELHAPLPHQQLLDVQKKALFGIVPSTWDMFNFTGVEYLKNGTPLICSSEAGMSSLIENGVNGFVYRDNDPNELAAHIRKIVLLSKSEYESIVREGYKLVANELAASILIPINIRHYEHLKLVSNTRVGNLYLESVYAPTHLRDVTQSILNHLPLKFLVNYLFERITERIRGR